MIISKYKKYVGKKENTSEKRRWVLGVMEKGTLGGVGVGG